jgi:hypothetical protein
MQSYYIFTISTQNCHINMVKWKYREVKNSQILPLTIVKSCIRFDAALLVSKSSSAASAEMFLLKKNGCVRKIYCRAADYSRSHD